MRQESNRVVRSSESQEEQASEVIGTNLSHLNYMLHLPHSVNPLYLHALRV